MFRRLNEQDHYQVLEIPYDATYDEIQSAYESARDIYSHEALVSGSILSEHERRGTFDRIAEAYQTLIAEESRRLYDQRLGLVGERRSEITVAASVTTARTLANTEAKDNEAEAVEPELKPSSPADGRDTGPRECPLRLDPSEEATGAFLRKAREAMGLELATISEETKIGTSTLEYIENERVDRLPAPVYLRNFTRQFALCLGLDDDRVARTYVERVRRLAE